jgi:hypothetical protein
VQKTGIPAYDTILEDALAKYWTVTKYKTLTEKRLAKEYGREDVSFLMPLSLGISYGGNFSNGINYSMIALIMGGDSKLEISDIIAYAQTEYTGITGYNTFYNVATGFADEKDNNMKGFLYRIEDIIRGINDAVMLVKKNKCRFKPGLMDGPKYMNRFVYNKEAVALKNKTLYVQFGNVEDMTKAKKAYPYKIKFVGREEFDEVVAGKVPDAVYMLLTKWYTFDMLILTDPISHKCLGGLPFGYVTTIDAGDFKDLVKYIESGTDK